VVEVINLNRFRKQRQRAESEAQAQENRIRHGRTGAEKARDRKEADQSVRLLDDKRLGSGDGSERISGKDTPD